MTQERKRFRSNSPGSELICCTGSYQPPSCPSFALRLTETIQNLHADDVLHDVTIVIGNEKIPCHRIILAASSKYFRAMFSIGMTETREREIVLNHGGAKEDGDNGAPIFRAFLHYLYYGNLGRLLSIRELVGLLRLADVYVVDHLLNICTKELVKRINLDNCLYLLQVSNEVRTPVPTFFSSCLKFVVTMGIEELVPSAFAPLDPDLLFELLSCDNLNVTSELKVLQIAISWILGAKSRHHYTDTITTLLSAVRFPLVPKHDLVQVVRGSTVQHIIRPVMEAQFTQAVSGDLEWRPRCKGLISLQDCVLQREVGVDEGRVWCMCPVGATVWVGGRGCVQVYDARTWKKVRTLGGFVKDVRAIVAFGRTVVTAAYEGTVKIWNAFTYDCVRVLDWPQGHEDIVRALLIYRHYVVCGCGRGSLKIFDLRTGKLIHTCKGHSDCIYTLAPLTLSSPTPIPPTTAPTGAPTAPGASSRSSASEPTPTHPTPPTLPPTGPTAHPLSTELQPVERCGADEEGPATRSRTSSSGSAVSVLPPAATALGGEAGGAEEESNNSSEDGFIAALSVLGQNDVADVLTSRTKRRSSSHTHSRTSSTHQLAFNRDLSQSQSQSDGANPTEFPALPSLPRRRDDDPCDSCSFDRFVSAGRDQTFRVWNCRTFLCERVIQAHEGGVFSAIQWGRYLVTGGHAGRMSIWNTRTWNEVLQLSQHRHTVRALAIHGDMLISGSNDSSCVVWDPHTFEPVHSFQSQTENADEVKPHEFSWTHRNLINQVVLSLCVHGQQVITGHYGGFLRIWN